MSRYLGPRLKVMRSLGVNLPGLGRKTLENRPSRPGQHGQKQQRLSDYGEKLQEKQKLRFNYGLTEKQMRRAMVQARRMREATGDMFLVLLERRLDNMVFRAGFAPSVIAARQLVSHRHVLLNGKQVNIPSLRIKIGDVITLKASSRRLPMVQEALVEPALTRPEWLIWDEATQTARVSRLPDASEVPFPVEVQKVVEFYANRL